MKVSSSQPFQIIYSLFQHEYLGYLFESFVVRVDDTGKLTFQHQNISSKNSFEFQSGLDEKDFQLIELMDKIQQDVVVRKFSKKNLNPTEFFLKVYDKEKGNKLVQEEIENYIERKRSQILELLKGKMVFEMGNDGEPAGKQLQVLSQKASVLFHFRRNEDNTHYFPTIKLDGEKLEFQYKGAYIICLHPAWIVVEGKLFTFEKDVDGKKLKPFLNKKFIVVPKNIEETYYSKFIAPLIATFDVYAKGFEIHTEIFDPVPVLEIEELFQSKTGTLALYDDNKTEAESPESKITFKLKFKYGSFKLRYDISGQVNVSMEKKGDDYVFHRIKRNTEYEKGIIKFLNDKDLLLKNGKIALHKIIAFDWLNNNRNILQDRGFLIEQKMSSGKKYFMGESSIKIEVSEGIDWFDIKAIIHFGPYQIPFKELRKFIIKNKTEFTLPNGEIAVIPESWVKQYSELFSFAVVDHDEKAKLRKFHLSLVSDLKSHNLAKVTMSRKLEKLKDFEEIQNYKVPVDLKGKLRNYQKAGYNWLKFLEENKFGGILADDMGLGKTIQTLSLLLEIKNNQKQKGASLLIMPTSLIYNWENEAKKFAPDLKLFTYTGTTRDKSTKKFDKYDIILTTYGIIRLDIDSLVQYSFNYIILDESQAIKNPDSNIAKAVKRLQSVNRLALTGTPLENTTLDLWSQLDFVNPGLLGMKSFFRSEFLVPIEKHGNSEKTKKLGSIIKPFILRRHKSQVATELPDKIENVQYCTMSAEQEDHYNKVKNYFRDKIIEAVEEGGIGKNQMMILQGLTKLRQIANHPILDDETYEGDSGKMETIIEMLVGAIQENHKILIFSQFVKHLKLIRNYLDEQKIPYAYLDGSTSNRQEQVEKFQNDTSINLFLISLKAGGVGLNLTKADYVFILDPWWNPAAEAQAIDRTHRIGQLNKVFAYKFVARDTVEEKILALQQRKLQLSQDLIKTEESFMKSLTKEDLELILS